MLNAADYAFLADFLRRRSGLSITSEKTYLIESRLKPVALRSGFKTATELVRRLRSEDEALARTVTEAMTTNETSFFRDKCSRCTGGSQLDLEALTAMRDSAARPPARAPAAPGKPTDRAR